MSIWESVVRIDPPLLRHPSPLTDVLVSFSSASGRCTWMAFKKMAYFADGLRQPGTARTRDPLTSIFPRFRLPRRIWGTYCIRQRRLRYDRVTAPKRGKTDCDNSYKSVPYVPDTWAIILDEANKTVETQSGSAHKKCRSIGTRNVSQWRPEVSQHVVR